MSFATSPRRFARALLAAALGIVFIVPATAAAADKTAGKFAVTARLSKIEGTFPPNDLYDYAFVMKYVVVGGKLSGKELYVAHYKPRLARSEIKGKMKKYVRGTLKRFKAGAMHLLLLAPQLKKIWRGAIVDEYFARDRKSKRYWCLQVDLSKAK